MNIILKILGSLLLALLLLIIVIYLIYIYINSSTILPPTQKFGLGVPGQCTYNNFGKLIPLPESQPCIDGGFNGSNNQCVNCTCNNNPMGFGTITCTLN